MNPLKEPSEVLDGADMNQDLHHLIGHVWQLALVATRDDDCPMSHLADLVELFLAKHRRQNLELYRWFFGHVATSLEAIDSSTAGREEARMTLYLIREKVAAVRETIKERTI